MKVWVDLDILNSWSQVKVIPQAIINYGTAAIGKNIKDPRDKDQVGGRDQTFLSEWFMLADQTVPHLVFQYTNTVSSLSFQ